MAPYQDWAILAAFVFAYSAIAGRIEKTWISGAIVFVVFGLLAGSTGLEILQFDVESEDLRTLAELTLAVILFTDAANANLPLLKNSVRLPTRLLLNIKTEPLEQWSVAREFRYRLKRAFDEQGIHVGNPQQRMVLNWPATAEQPELFRKQ